MMGSNWFARKSKGAGAYQVAARLAAPEDHGFSNPHRPGEMNK
jgi:hypothetical protein